MLPEISPYEINRIAQRIVNGTICVVVSMEDEEFVWGLKYDKMREWRRDAALNLGKWASERFNYAPMDYRFAFHSWRFEHLPTFKRHSLIWVISDSNNAYKIIRAK